MSRNPIEDEAFRTEICDWLRANDLDPRTTPANPFPKIADGQLTILRKIQRDGRDGRDVVNEQRTDVLKETITVPLKVQPSADIAAWIAWTMGG